MLGLAMFRCPLRWRITVGLLACVLPGWVDRVFADTANVNNPNLQIYQLPKMQNAVDDKLKNDGANQQTPEGGAIDDVPPSDSGTGDGVQNGPTTDGDYDDTKSKKKKQDSPINLPLGPIIELIPPLIQQKQKPQELADLHFSNSIATFDEGTQRVSLSYCVINSGEGASKATKVAINDRSGGPTVGTYEIGPLSPGEHACRDGIWVTIAAGFTGTRRYDLVVDPYKAVTETREDNNTAVATVEIQLLPDLTIASFSATPDATGRRVALALCIANPGKSAVNGAEVTIRDRAAISVVANASLGSLPAGGRLCRNDLSAAVPAAFNGKRTYDANVDPKSRVAESNEDNNAASAIASISALPDLAFAESSATFDEAARQAVLSFCFVNRGKVAVKQTSVSIREVGAGTIENPTMGPVAPGARACGKQVASVPADFAGARKYVLAVDPQRKIAESNEDNNTASIALTIPFQKPDLSFPEASAKFDEVAREMVLSFCVINRGKTPSTETRVSIRDPATGAEVKSPRIAPLASDQRTCRDGLLMPLASGFSGTQRYELSLDPDAKVDESDETNNAAKAEAHVTALANLAFADSSIRFDEATRHATLSFCVINRGETPSNETAVSIRDSGTAVKDLKVGSLSASNQACFSDVAMPVLEDFAGTQSYELIADAGNTTTESDENDNTRALSVAVPELPAPTEYETSAGPTSDPASEAEVAPFPLFVLGIGGVAALTGAIVFLLARPRRGRSAEPVSPDAIQFRGRADPGTQITHSTLPEIVLPKLQLRGHVDPGRQRIEMHETAMRVAGE